MIIGFAGRKTSGKTTAAGALVEMGCHPYSFAQPLKNMADVLLVALGLDGDELAEAYDAKEQIIHPCEVSMRHLLQTLGTEWGRQQIHPDLWVMCAQAYFERFSGFDHVIDDVRFENEAALIRKMGGVIIHVTRPGLDGGDRHASEQGIAFVGGDILIDNDGDVEDLQATVAMWVDALLTERAA